jgi:CRISPR/Cas system-associated endonuclease Cas1
MDQSLLLIVDNADSSLLLEGRALRVNHGDDEFQRIPLRLLGQLVIHGNANVRCDVWRALAERNISATLLPGRGKGATARVWFSCLAAAAPGQWQFSGRNRRPPRDPLNALLSLSYTLVEGEIRRAVQAHGLDPARGFLHQPAPARDSLVLDLLEIYRPSVDAFALDLLHNSLEPKHFDQSQRDGCRLSQDGRRIFYPAWARARRQWPGEFLARVEWAAPSQDPESLIEPSPDSSTTSLFGNAWLQVQGLIRTLHANAREGKTQ